MYRNSIFVDFDLEKAVALYRKSAKLGYPAAQNNLGVILEKGEIDGQADIKGAFELFKKAAEKGRNNLFLSISYLLSLLSIFDVDILKTSSFLSPPILSFSH